MENESSGTDESLGTIDGGASGDNGATSPPRRGRGRPRNDAKRDSGDANAAHTGDAGEPGIDAVIGNRDGDSGSVGVGKPGKRGRKPGKRRSAAEIQDRLNSTGVVLFAAHAMLADMLKAPVMVLSEAEAQRLAKALVDCADAWDFNPVTDPRVTTSIALAITAAGLYLPRLAALKATKRAPETGHAGAHAQAYTQ